MQEAKQLVCAGQIANPRIPGCIEQANTVADKDVENDDYRIGRVESDDDVSHKTTHSAHKSDATLTY